jgi:hypothetical protein
MDGSTLALILMGNRGRMAVMSLNSIVVYLLRNRSCFQILTSQDRYRLNAKKSPVMSVST